MHILDVTRGAPYEFGLQEFDTTVLKVKITSATANTDLTSAELNAIHDTIVGAQGKANKDEGLDLTVKGMLRSPPRPSPTALPPCSTRQGDGSAGATLQWSQGSPGGSTGLPRQGFSGTYEGGSRSPTGASCPSSVRVSRASVWPSSWLW